MQQIQNRECLNFKTKSVGESDILHLHFYKAVCAILIFCQTSDFINNDNSDLENAS